MSRPHKSSFFCIIIETVAIYTGNYDDAALKTKEVREIQNWMNPYPRRILNGSTPLLSFTEAFDLMNCNIKALEAC